MFLDSLNKTQYASDTLMNIIPSQILIRIKYNNFIHVAISPSISDMISCFIILSCMPSTKSNWHPFLC
jgi:hypothetical protein